MDSVVHQAPQWQGRRHRLDRSTPCLPRKPRATTGTICSRRWLPSAPSKNSGASMYVQSEASPRSTIILTPIAIRTTSRRPPNLASRPTTTSSRRAYGPSGRTPKTSTVESGRTNSRTSAPFLSTNSGCTRSWPRSARPSRTTMTTK
jgi:hypothetical protein